MIATTVIILTAGLISVLADEIKNINKLQPCPNIEISNTKDFGSGSRTEKWNNCWGKYTIEFRLSHKGDVYEGEWVDGQPNGKGNYFHLADNQFKGDKYSGDIKEGKKSGLGVNYYANGNKYIGEFKDGRRHGQGKFIYADGRPTNEGNWLDGKFVKSESNEQNSSQKNELAVKEEKKINREQAVNNQHINLQVSNTQPNDDGDFVINIQTNADTASLKVNGEEFGGKADGIYTIRRVARAGQETKFKILAKDTGGNVSEKIISVTRQVAASSAVKYAELNPTQIKKQLERDAVAVIIGIAEYKNLPKADYANDDARIFYDYAIRGLGIKPENIKLLVDADAGQGEILKTFKTWLPARVKATTDVYVYYSGHGLPSADGQTLYLLPQQADRDLIEDTAVAQSRINAAIQAAKPKSVTIFLDSCYSGAARTGQTLIASARPISLKANTQTFPPDFTVFTASTAEQISSSSPDLKHGIFSYYLMKGMEGDADTNKDGKITTGEMQSYLMDNVVRQASLSNRVQQPQLTGDANRILMGK